MRNVKVEVSGVVPAPIGIVWKLLSAFSDTLEYRFTNNDIEAILSQQKKEHKDGKRAVIFVDSNRRTGCLYEEITWLDQENYSLQYKLTSDPRNVNPFPASFLDVLSSIRLYRCTIDDTTFMRICSTFNTEIEMSGIMSATWERTYKDMVGSLICCLSQRKQGQTAAAEAPCTPGSESPPRDEFGSRTTSAPSLPAAWAGQLSGCPYSSTLYQTASMSSSVSSHSETPRAFASTYSTPYGKRPIPKSQSQCSLTSGMWLERDEHKPLEARNSLVNLEAGPSTPGLERKSSGSSKPRKTASFEQIANGQCTGEFLSLGTHGVGGEVPPPRARLQRVSQDFLGTPPLLPRTSLDARPLHARTSLEAKLHEVPNMWSPDPGAFKMDQSWAGSSFNLLTARK